MSATCPPHCALLNWCYRIGAGPTFNHGLGLLHHTYPKFPMSHTPLDDSSSTPTAHGAEQPLPASGYAGDVTPALAAAWWQAGDAVLVDVRSDAEREWVGYVPGAIVVAWKQWPGMAMNPNFDAELRAAVPLGGKLVLLCRSGVRSIGAARRATELGLEAYNILEGFEGDPDSAGRRGNMGGWRQRGLPWRQG